MSIDYDGQFDEGAADFRVVKQTDDKVRLIPTRIFEFANSAPAVDG
jgi:hypothetical protein